MTNPIREKYFAAVSELERLELIASYTGSSQEESSRNETKLRELETLHLECIRTLPPGELFKLDIVQNRVKLLFVPNVPQSRGWFLSDQEMKAYFETKTVHHLRVALENNFPRLAHECFMKMPHNRQKEAFELLCRTYGSTNNDTVEDGCRHVAYNPEYLLSTAKNLPGSPRIIDVLLQQKKSAAPIDLGQLLEFYTADGTNSKGQTRKQIVAQADLLNLDEKEIQWLFPLQQDVDDPYFSYNFTRASGWLARFQNVFMGMFKAYGLEYDPACLRRIPEAVQARESFWPNLNMTQHHHIERILKCLMALGFDNVARPFFAALKDIAANEGKDAISDDMLKAWSKAVTQ